MRKQQFDYNFDIKYEVLTYRKVGCDYYGNKRKSARHRSKKNRNENYYKYCYTYTEWRDYLKEKYQKSCSLNFQKYLNRELQRIHRRYESFKAVLIPIEVGLLTAIVPLLNFATCEPQLYLSLYILVIGAIFSACCFFSHHT